MSQEPSEAVYEMMWDCKYCSQKKLLGVTHRFCAGCGAPQDPSSRYSPPDDEKVAVNDHPFVGADVTCPACRHPMSRAAKCCTNCGGPIDKGAEVARKDDLVVPPPGMPTAPLVGAGGFVAAAPPEAPKKGKGMLIGAIVAIAAIAIVGLLVALFWKREGVFEVAGHTWQRNIAVERYESVRKNAWCDEMPAGARESARRREKRGTKKVEDGQTCGTRKKDQGNGTFKEVRECQPKYREEPVMSDKCDFDVTEWRSVRTATAGGSSPKDPPKWPSAGLSRPGSCLGCEREGTRSERYTVNFIHAKSKEAATCDLPESRWATFAKGSRWKGKVRVMTGGLDCNELQVP